MNKIEYKKFIIQLDAIAEENRINLFNKLKKIFSAKDSVQLAKPFITKYNYMLFNLLSMYNINDDVVDELDKIWEDIISGQNKTVNDILKSTKLSPVLPITAIVSPLIATPIEWLILKGFYDKSKLAQIITDTYITKSVDLCKQKAEENLY